MIIFNAYFMGAYPRSLFLKFVTFYMLLHIGWRHIYYIWALKSGFYLTDYCYLSCYMMLYLINFGYGSETLLRLCFLSSNGALALAVIIFRNTLAIHRIDHLTNLCTHLVPMIVTQTLRWHIAPREALLDESERTFAVVNDDITWEEWRKLMLWYPLGVYLTWSMVNGSIQFIFCKSYIERTNQETLYMSMYSIGWGKKIQ